MSHRKTLKPGFETLKMSLEWRLNRGNDLKLEEVLKDQTSLGGTSRMLNQLRAF